MTTFNPELLQKQIHIHNDICIKGFFNTSISNDRWLSNMQETKIIWMNMELKVFMRHYVVFQFLTHYKFLLHVIIASR